MTARSAATSRRPPRLVHRRLRDQPTQLVPRAGSSSSESFESSCNAAAAPTHVIDSSKVNVQIPNDSGDTPDLTPETLSPLRSNGRVWRQIEQTRHSQRATSQQAQH